MAGGLWLRSESEVGSSLDGRRRRTKFRELGGSSAPQSSFEIGMALCGSEQTGAFCTYMRKGQICLRGLTVSQAITSPDFLRILKAIFGSPLLMASTAFANMPFPRFLWNKVCPASAFRPYWQPTTAASGLARMMAWTDGITGKPRFIISEAMDCLTIMCMPSFRTTDGGFG